MAVRAFPLEPGDQSEAEEAGVRPVADGPVISVGGCVSGSCRLLLWEVVRVSQVRSLVMSGRGVLVLSSESSAAVSYSLSGEDELPGTDHHRHTNGGGTETSGCDNQPGVAGVEA